MYKNLIIKKTFIAIGIIFAAAGILVALIFLNLDTYKTYDDHQQMLLAFLYGGAYLLVWYFVFWRYLTRVRIKPNSSVAASQVPMAEELKSKIRAYFAEATEGDQPVFLVEDIQNGLMISWNRQIDFKQILSYGSKSVNYQVSVFFDEKKHIGSIHSKIVHISKSLGITGGSYSWEYKGGMIYEEGREYVPSFSLKDGQVHMDIKKLSYGNATMVDPIIEILKTNGWTSQFLTLKHKVSRAMYSIVGSFLLAVSLLMILVGLLSFAMQDFRGDPDFAGFNTFQDTLPD